MKLEGRVALITGADGAIGTAIALRFAREGAVVVLNDIVSRHLERVATEIAEVEHGTSLIALGDVTRPPHVDRMVREALDAFGRVDILVNHAGDNEQLARHGASLCAAAVLPAMCERRWGRIINSSSVAGIAHPGRPQPTPEDAGMPGLTRQLALKYAPDGITVNCVAPGAAMAAVPAVPDERKDTMTTLIPIGRIAEPREIAAAYAFFAADDAAYVTGHVLIVDGGLSLTG